MLTPPIQKSQEVKEAPENEAEEQNSTQNGEGYAISCIRGAPTTDTVSGGEDQEQNMQIMAQEWSPDQPKDPENPHIHRSVYMQSVSLNNRFYVFQNWGPSNSRPVRIIDP